MIPQGGEWFATPRMQGLPQAPGRNWVRFSNGGGGDEGQGSKLRLASGEFDAGGPIRSEPMTSRRWRGGGGRTRSQRVMKRKAKLGDWSEHPAAAVVSRGLLMAGPASSTWSRPPPPPEIKKVLPLARENATY